MVCQPSVVTFRYVSCLIFIAAGIKDVSMPDVTESVVTDTRRILRYEPANKERITIIDGVNNCAKNRMPQFDIDKDVICIPIVMVGFVAEPLISPGASRLRLRLLVSVCQGKIS